MEKKAITIRLNEDTIAKIKDKFKSLDIKFVIVTIIESKVEKW